MMSGWYGDSLARYGLKIISYPVAEPVTLAEAKLHLRVDDDGDSPPAHPDDSLITTLITAAREWCEGYAGRSLAPQVLEIAGNQFTLPVWTPCACARWSVDNGSVIYNNFIDLPWGPVESVISVRYLDSDGIEQTVTSSDYLLDTYGPSRLYAAFGFSWPTMQAVANAVRIRYVAGYSLPGDSPNPYPMPASIRAAILLVLGHLYENREQTTDLKLEELPLGAQSLLNRYRLRLGLA